jgi:O-antigen ligase
VSFAQATAEPARPRAWPALAAAYFGYALIGLHPLADVSARARADGSPLDRVAVLAMSALALAVLWPLRREAAAALGRRPAFVAVSAVIALSALWSDHPDLTLRRAALFALLALCGLAVALGAGSARRLHEALFAALTGAVLVNLLAALAAPSLAVTEIGVRGVYSQKNVAGAVAMAAVIVAAFRPAGTARWAALALAGGLLALTRSKTSLGLTGLTLALSATLAFAGSGRRAAAIALAVGLAALALALALFAASGFDTARALERALGDSSFTGRDELWAFARRHIAEAPWLGHGYGAFWDVGPVDDPIAKLEPGTWLGDTEVGTINQAHDGYLDLALNIGLPSTALATLAVIGATFRARGVYAALGFAFLLHNLTEASLFLRGAPLWAVMVVALFAPEDA